MPAALYESEPAGHLRLRQAIAQIVCPTRGIVAHPDEIVVASSTQTILALLASDARGRGGRALMESPGYFRARALFEHHGLDVQPLPVDDEGALIGPAAERVTPETLIYVTPSVQFPTGVALANHRRRELIDLAERRGAWIVEDDFDAQPGFGGRIPPPMKAGPIVDRVIYLSSLNRLLFPSVRCAFAVVPAAIRERMVARSDALDTPDSLVNQLVLSQFIEQGGYTAHLRMLRDVLPDRRDALLRLLRPWFGSVFDPAVNASGWHIVLRPLRHSGRAVATEFRAAGLAASSVGELDTVDTGADGLLLGFAAFTPAQIEAAAGVVERVCTGLAQS